METGVIGSDVYGNQQGRIEYYHSKSENEDENIKAIFNNQIWHQKFIVCSKTLQKTAYLGISVQGQFYINKSGMEYIISQEHLVNLYIIII